ncbi:hypothetical protein TEA_027720 [Camellia sinensis var. sinensis]|uniref:Uncharacterized protein n=1 Tax=Camellia sinensis var. sinensis TaxID=542762 RepID=A0A4S4D5C7_CAMSN|nr:hypothetical protein TEA_027720 [Camellia sinensis var. sinensis]
MSTIVVSSPEIVREVMKTHDIVFVQRPYSFASRILSYDSQNIVFSPHGDYWRQMRKICIMELLSAKRVQSFRAIREEKVLNLVKLISLNKTSPINLSKKIFLLTYGVTARVAFEGKTKGQEEFVSIVEEVADMITIVGMYPSVKLFQVISGIRRTLKKMHKRIDQILENICGKRDIINNRRSGNVRNAENPQVMKRAQAKVRRVFEATYLSSIDPKYWNEAEKFDPERFLHSEIDFKGRDFEFIPFGAGRRICPGISFAIPNIELPLAQLLYHFEWKLPDGKNHEELDMEEDLGLIVRRKNDLILIPIPYDQSSFFC